MAGTEPGIEWLRGLIRSIPDFPRPGIVFYDVTPLFADPAALAGAAAELHVHSDAIPPGARVLVHDDLIELTFLAGRDRLPAPTHSLISFDE